MKRFTFALSLCLSLMLCAHSFAADTRQAARSEIIKLVSQLAQPAMSAPEADKAWSLEISGEVMGKKGSIHVAWDGKARHYASVDIPEVGKAQLAFGQGESWLFDSKHNKVYHSKHDAPTGDSLLTNMKAWQAAVGQVPMALGALMFLPVPDEMVLEKDEDGTIRLADEDKKNILEIRKGEADDKISLTLTGEYAGQLEISRWSQVPTSEFDKLLGMPAAAVKEEVEIEHLAGMYSTLVDFAAEALLVRVNPKSVPDPLAGIPRVEGVAIVKLKGTPEEMGRQHGTILKEAINYNMRRTLHGVGLVSTLETGKWFPSELANAWAAQEKYIPARYVQEIDALSDASGMPRDWGRSVNVFPELFHCSGLALCGSATVGGKLIHGRVLDYMTQIGLQNTAVVMVFEPTDRNAWVSVGYAGQASTVTAMNDKGLSMGEMGGRGEGYLDGMPMSFMMREVVERFTTTKEALDWMRDTPRTCEYYYVLTDSKTKTMAGVASYAKKLAEEKGVPDFLVIEPGESYEQLPQAIEDAVLMSAGDRYDRLAQRIKEGHGKFDMESSWKALGKGVAMGSNLHTVLFAPETLDFWVANAGPEGQPAFTQPTAKLNLKTLLAQEPATQTSDAGSVK